MLLVVKRNIYLGGGSHRSSAYQQSDIIFCCPKSINICKGFGHNMLQLDPCEAYKAISFSLENGTLSHHMFFWSGANMFGELMHWMIYNTQGRLQKARALPVRICAFGICFVQFQKQNLEHTYDISPWACLGSGRAMTLHMLAGDQPNLTLKITAESDKLFQPFLQTLPVVTAWHFTLLLL